MSRATSVSILVLVVLLGALGVVLSRTETSVRGCDGVRRAHERVVAIEEGNEVPTSGVYAEAAVTVRESAVDVPEVVAQDLRRLAVAYERLGELLRGFRPEDESTYHVYEENAAAIEAEQATVDATLPAVQGWLDSHCS